MSSRSLSLPSKGRSPEEILDQLRALKARDAPWQEGRVFSLVYHVDEALDRLLVEAHRLFFFENALNPTAFPSLRRLETEVVAMAARLFHGDEKVVGNMTSGGTESLLLAVKTARDWGRANRPLSGPPEMVLPETAHPAFHKAAHYFGVRPIVVPVDADFRADPEAMERAITPNTVLMVGSAPAYPHGTLDPIPALAEVARRHGILFHVDACVGGFFLPFAERLGREIEPWDFRVPGVTSLSADLHKYGYAAKGASVILYRTPELRRHQFFAYTDWSGGIYASPAVAGTRPAGPIAAAWAVLHYLGEEGYTRLAARVLETAERIRRGVEGIPGLRILGRPVMGILALAAEGYDIYEVADEMALCGWHLDRQHRPPSLHLTLTPAHAAVVDRFLADLEAAAAAARRGGLRRRGTRLLLGATNRLLPRLPAPWRARLRRFATAHLGGGSASGLPERSAPLYGLMGTLPTREDVREAVLDLLDQLFRPPEG